MRRVKWDLLVFQFRLLVLLSVQKLHCFLQLYNTTAVMMMS